MIADIRLDEGWVIIDVERVLYVDRGIDVILCDRLHAPTPTTLLVRMTPEQRARARLVLFGDGT